MKVQNGSESDDSDSDDENHYKNNEQQQLFEAFANSYYKINLPILLQTLITDFALCKHCSRTLLLDKDITSSHGFGD